MHIVPGRFGLILRDHKRQRNTADLDRSAQHAAMHALSLVNINNIWVASRLFKPYTTYCIAIFLKLPYSVYLRIATELEMRPY